MAPGGGVPHSGKRRSGLAPVTGGGPERQRAARLDRPLAKVVWLSRYGRRLAELLKCSLILEAAMIRSTAYALKLLRREGFLNEAAHPAEPPYWTISTDPELAGDPSAHHVAESVAWRLVESGAVRHIGDGCFVLTGRPSDPPATASSSPPPASPRASSRPSARALRPTAAADRPR
jgi:hypothetical protein